jgi:ketosteroid isomerase-like protein
MEMDRRSILAVMAAPVAVVPVLVVPSPAAAEELRDEARALFERFVAAQNAHDAEAVEATLSDTPDFLWITRGTAIWGRAAAMERFRALYRGTWRLEPDMAQFRAVALGSGAAQIFVPVLFTIGAAGQTAQPTRFLLNQTLRREGDAWRVASILPVPLPPS